MTIKNFFLQISIWIVLLPLSIGIIFIKKLNKESLIVLGIVVLATIPQLLTAFIMNTTTQVVVYNIYTPVEFYLTYLLFRNKLNIADKNLFRYSIFIYVIASTFILTSSGILNFFLNEWVCLNNLTYMLWILLFLKRQYNLKEVEISKRNPFTWFLLGLSLYAPCTLLVFAFYHYLRAHPLSVLKNLWVIHNFFNILMYMLFTIGFITNFYIKKRHIVSQF